MTETPDRGPESEIKETKEDQRAGHEPEDLLRSTDREQAERERALGEDERSSGDQPG